MIITRKANDYFQNTVKKKASLDRLAEAYVWSNCLLMAKNIAIAGSSDFARYNAILNILVLLISGILYIYALVKMPEKRMIKAGSFICCVGIFLYWFFTYFLNRELFTYSFVIDEIESFIIYGLPALVFLPYLKNCEALLETYYKLRWLLLVCIIVSVALMLYAGEIQGSGTRNAVYSMSFGRALIMPSILFISSWFKTNKARDLLGAIVCVLCILFFGSRFPLLCIACFGVWKLIAVKKSKKMQIFILVVSIAIFSFLIFMEEILEWVYKLILTEFGINSRSLLLFLTGSFTTDTGRSGIHQKLFEKVNESPIFGYGAGGSIVALDNIQPHGFVYDAFGCFGYIFGTLFLLCVVFIVFRTYRRNQFSESNKEYIIICICMFVPICFLQLSIGSAQYFWVLVALYFSGMRDERKNQDD